MLKSQQEESKKAKKAKAKDLELSCSEEEEEDKNLKRRDRTLKHSPLAEMVTPTFTHTTCIQPRPGTFYGQEVARTKNIYLNKLSKTQSAVDETSSSRS